MKSVHLLSLLASLPLGVAACGGAPEPPPETPPQPAPPVAEAPAPVEASPAGDAPAAQDAAPTGGAAPVSIEVPIEARSNSQLKGTASFTEVDGGVKVSIQVTGAPAGAGQIAVHVHEKGDCSAPDAKSAGDHYNPENHPHGLPDAPARHLGDLGNITIQADGSGTHEIVAKGANLKKDAPNSFVGRAIIVHEKRDDGGQPAGNAGARIGCGVIAAK